LNECNKLLQDAKDAKMKKREIVAQKSQPIGRQARGAADGKGGRDFALVTYSVTARPQSRGDEKRREQRRRTRLRAGKILDRRNRFLTDATIFDRSCGGLRLRLPLDFDVPDLFHFFDEEIESIFVARVAWRNRLVLGVRRGPWVAATPRQIAALRGKFYAIPD
jgi:hypothetical protein